MMTFLDTVLQQHIFVHVFAGVSMLVYIIFFILGAFGIRRMAVNRGLNKTWFAFVPVLQMSLVGKIADDIVSKKNKLSTQTERIGKYSVMYPALSLLNPINMVNSLLGLAMHLYLPEHLDPWYLGLASSSNMHINSLLLGVVEFFLLIVFISMIKEIFDDYDKENTNMYVALSVFFKLHLFILFFLRHRQPFEYKYTKFDDEYYDNFNDFTQQVGD